MIITKNGTIKELATKEGKITRVAKKGTSGVEVIYRPGRDVVIPPPEEREF
ncbi:hypothetical protein FACS1894145_7640 [Bacteroidia bacterium]|nr:hypothetical protein FACS1894145_7640 [Bacteroidia bacterium]